MKIYTEVNIDMNPESSSYGEHLHEESFEYDGPIGACAVEVGPGWDTAQQIEGMMNLYDAIAPKLIDHKGGSLWDEGGRQAIWNIGSGADRLVMFRLKGPGRTDKEGYWVLSNLYGDIVANSWGSGTGAAQIDAGYGKTANVGAWANQIYYARQDFKNKYPDKSLREIDEDIVLLEKDKKGESAYLEAHGGFTGVEYSDLEAILADIPEEGVIPTVQDVKYEDFAAFIDPETGAVTDAPGMRGYLRDTFPEKYGDMGADELDIEISGLPDLSVDPEELAIKKTEFGETISGLEQDIETKERDIYGFQKELGKERQQALATQAHTGVSGEVDPAISEGFYGNITGTQSDIYGFQTDLESETGGVTDWYGLEEEQEQQFYDWAS